MSKKPKIESFKHIAVIQTAFLGDIALSFYLLQNLKEINPEVKLSFITTKLGSEIAQAVECIDDIMVFDKRGIHKSGRGLRVFAKMINQQKPDCIISLHKSYRTSKLVSKLKAKYKVGFDNAALSYFVYNFRQKYHPSLSEINRSLSLLNAFDIDSKKIKENIHVKVQFSEKIKNDLKNFLPAEFNNSDIIAVAPGSIWATKRWIPEYFEETVKMLLQDGKKCILIGSNSDEIICGKIEEHINNWDADLCGTSLLNLCGKTNLIELLHILSLVRITLTNDSAPAHLSELVNTPAAVIFGPTSPIFGFAPHLSKSEIIELTSLACRPCEIHGSDKCPIKTHDCMKLLTPEIVFEIIEEMDTY